MNFDKTFYLGKISKKFSYKGELLIYLDTDEPYLYTELESVFVNFNGNLIPFFIEKSSIHKNEFLRVKFEDVDSEAEADKLIGLEVHLPTTLLPKLEGTNFYFHEIIGYSVEDKQKGAIGVIVDVNDTTLQALFVIENKEKKQILIPIIDDFILSVDRTNKIIHLDTPKGLIDLYLE
ncbi:MAG: ribosome maturation factor RimM [Bacteroidota bacterium]|nr:ribosome maturation factor RimM [Bacteroidota bacterium]